MRVNAWEKEIIKKLDAIATAGCGGVPTPTPPSVDSESRFQTFQEVCLDRLNSISLAGCGGNIDVINLELQLTDTLARYKEFFYNGNGDIINLKIWNSPLLTTQFFNIVYGYTGDNLTTITTTRISDAYVFTKTLAYDINNNLTSINITIPV